MPARWMLSVLVAGLLCAPFAACAKPGPLAPRAKDQREKKILAVLDQMDRHERRGMMNVPQEDGRLLRLLAESINARKVVEIGTSNGYSGIWLCLALMRTGGALTTYEIDARRAARARKNFKRAGVEGLVTLVLGDAHRELARAKGPIDLVFIDADKDGYTDYLKKLLPRLRPGGLIVAHNIAMRAAGINAYLQELAKRTDVETLLLNMHDRGVSVSMKKRP